MIVPVRNTVHTRVRNPIRKKVKGYFDANRELFKMRYIIAYNYCVWRALKSGRRNASLLLMIIFRTGSFIP